MRWGKSVATTTTDPFCNVATTEDDEGDYNHDRDHDHDHDHDHDDDWRKRGRSA